MKKFTCGLVAASVVAMNSLTGYAVTFTDINDVPWAGAQTYINNAANAGLMNGETNNKGQLVFRARSNVTYCEAVQLAYNLLKKNNNVVVSSTVVSKWITTMVTYNIPNWAYDAVAYALENNIISTSDITKFMKSNGTSNYATRQDVAVVFGKVLAKDNMLNNYATLSFSDANQISIAAIPYIELLTRLNILVGDSNNRFNPNNNINRSEMAVITYNTYNHMQQTQALPKQVTGTVVSNKEVSTGRYTLMVSIGGQEKMFVIPSTVQVINGSKTVTPSTITAKDIVLLTYTGYEVSAAMITYDAVVEQESKLEGVITYLRTDKIQIKTKEGNSYQYTIKDPEDISIKIDGKSKDIDDLIDEYHEDEDITVLITLDKNDKYVDKIVATTDGEDDDDYDGKITSLTTSRLKLNNKSTTYSIDDEDEIDVNVEDGANSNITDFDDLKAAFNADKVIEAKIYLDKNDYVTKIVGEVVEVKGYLYSLKTSSEKLTIKVGSKYYDYKYKDEDDVDIEINNKNKDMDDLEDALEDAGTNKLEIKLTLDDSYITDIEVGDIEDDEDDDEIDGKLTSITSSRLKVSTETSYYKIDDEDKVDVDVDDGTENTLTDISDLKEALEDDDKEIQVTVLIKDGYVDEIRGEVVSVMGELTSVTTSGTIKVDVSSDDYTYKCSSSVEINVGTADTLSELRELIAKRDMDVKLTIKNRYVTKIED